AALARGHLGWRPGLGVPQSRLVRLLLADGRAESLPRGVGHRGHRGAGRLRPLPAVEESRPGDPRSRAFPPGLPRYTVLGYPPGRQTRRGDPDALRRAPPAIGLGRPLTAEAPGGVPDARGVEGGPVREVRGA